MNCLISYPRSGNTWMRYCLEFLSERPTMGVGVNMRERPLGETFNLGVNLEAAPIVKKMHYGKIRKNIERCIMILRDPYYCIQRHTGEIKEKSIKRYLRIIEEYDKFEGPKACVYYEDLLTDKLFDVLEEVCIVLEIPTHKMDSLKKDIFIHRQRCKMLYEFVRLEKNKHPVVLAESEILNDYLEHPEVCQEYLRRYRF